MRTTRPPATLSRVTTSPEHRKIRVVIELDDSLEPIQGALVEPAERPVAFRGWLAFTALIESVRTEPHARSRPSVG